MYYNGSKKPVVDFMQEVHIAMAAKYNSQKNDMTKRAKKLQNFFQDLQKIAQGEGKTSGAFDDIVLQNIVENSNKHLRGRSLSSNLFKRKGGLSFERELTAIITAVLEEAGGMNISLPEINIGSKLSNIDIPTEQISQKLLEELGVKVQKKITDKYGKTQKQLYLPSVQGKIDVRGYEIMISANLSSQVFEIYDLLRNATFSAKNYDSMTWDEKTRTLIEAGRKNLTLGNSNLLRAVYGALSSLNHYDSKTIMSAFYAGRNAIQQGNEELGSHFYHLRYIYELAGAGLNYSGVDYGEVQYLIYNDPHGKIYVKSVSEILSDVLNNHPMFKGNPFSGIYISKSSFK